MVGDRTGIIRRVIDLHKSVDGVSERPYDRMYPD